MKLSRFEAICFFLFVWLLISSCGAMRKIFHKEKNLQDSSSVHQVISKVEKTTKIDSVINIELTDSSVIETEFERTVTAEDYFVTIDSATKTPVVVRRTITKEKGKIKEQKAVEQHKSATHQDNSLEKKNETAKTATEVRNEAVTINSETDRKSFFNFTTLIWIVFIIIFLIIARRYLWPAIRDMINMPSV